jgi:sec-independent protein translocase protein TatA
MSVGFWQILIIVAVVVLLFGRGKISDLMGDVAKGIKSFKQGMAEDEPHPGAIEHNAAETVRAETPETKVKAS